MSDINEMNAGMQWYVVHTYSGYENKVKANLEKIVENRGVQHLITEVQIPTEIILENDGNGEKEIESKLLPSYILVRMIMCDESWHIVRTIRGVTGFVGPGSKPVPLTEEEVESLLGSVKNAGASVAVGDEVEIIGGIFSGYFGRVSEINEATGEATVIVSTVGNDTPLKVSMADIKAKSN